MARDGTKTGGGSRKGRPNKITAEIRERAAKRGELPLDYMLRVMRNSKAPDARRDAMATAAAPYLHSRLATTTIVGDPTQPVIFQMLNRPAKKEQK
jgi:hypothetical protein